MSQYALRLPDSLLKQARKTAQRDHVSMNQLFITAIAEKLAVLEAESLIAARAGQANLDIFKRILDRVPSAAVSVGDEILD